MLSVEEINEGPLEKGRERLSIVLDTGTKKAASFLANYPDEGGSTWIPKDVTMVVTR